MAGMLSSYIWVAGGDDRWIREMSDLLVREGYDCAEFSLLENRDKGFISGNPELLVLDGGVDERDPELMDYIKDGGEVAPALLVVGVSAGAVDWNSMGFEAVERIAKPVSEEEFLSKVKDLVEDSSLLRSVRAIHGHLNRWGLVNLALDPTQPVGSEELGALISRTLITLGAALLQVNQLMEDADERAQLRSSRAEFLIVVEEMIGGLESALSRADSPALREMLLQLKSVVDHDG